MSTASATANGIANPVPRSAPPPRGGRMERHGLRLPIASSAACPIRQSKSDGVPGGGDAETRVEDTPTRCVQRLSPAVGLVAQVGERRPKPRTHCPPPSFATKAWPSSQGEGGVAACSCDDLARVISRPLLQARVHDLAVLGY